jgi:hypothetical protein
MVLRAVCRAPCLYCLARGRMRAHTRAREDLAFWIAQRRDDD